MLLKLVIPTLACLICSLALSSPLHAQGETPTEDEMKEMMEKYKKAAEPGPEHKKLQKLAGKWNTVSKTMGMPGMPSEEAKGTMECRSLLGGRQIIQESQGVMMGMPFQGLFILGYDNITKEYVSTWTDNWSTGLYMTRGTADDSGKVITLKGEIRDAMSPVEPRPWRLVITLESDDKHSVDVYDTVAPGQEAKVITVTATRAK